MSYKRFGIDTVILHPKSDFGSGGVLQSFLIFSTLTNNVCGMVVV